MKKTILILISLLTFACQHNERSIGFTSLANDGEEYKFYLGTDSTIEVVKKFDQISKTKNYEELRKIFSDTAKFTYYNGVENTLDEFITLNQKRDSTLLANGETLTWSPQWALSVDINPKKGGEHVNMMYLAEYNGKEDSSKFYANLWFYVRNDKIITVNQYNQSINND